MMTVGQFLSGKDTERGERAFRKLIRNDTGSWVLTGGWAIEIHHLLRGQATVSRQLIDIDFITDSFDSLPATLARNYLFRHIHPSAQPGKTLLQAVDPDEALRIDVFRACGRSMSRTKKVMLANAEVRLIALEDLVARMARLAMDLVAGAPVPAKHARDFLRLSKLANMKTIELAWREHKRPNHPLSFQEVRQTLEEIIPVRPDLLIVPRYSTDVNEICPRCSQSPPFELAESESVFSLLGYV